MTRTRLLGLILMCVTWSSLATAQTANLTNLSGRVKEEATLFVYDNLQHERKVMFRDVAANGLVVEEYQRGDRKRQAVTIPTEQIRRIEEERRDGIGKGLGIGFAIGGGLALIGTAGCTQMYQYTAGECALASVVLYALPGIAIGGLIDWAIKERVTIYQASPKTTSTLHLSVAPLLTLGVAGAQVAWGF